MPELFSLSKEHMFYWRRGREVILFSYYFFKQNEPPFLLPLFFRETSNDCNRIHGEWSPRCISKGE